MPNNNRNRASSPKERFYDEAEVNDMIQKALFRTIIIPWIFGLAIGINILIFGMQNTTKAFSELLKEGIFYGSAMGMLGMLFMVFIVMFKIWSQNKKRRPRMVYTPEGAGSQSVPPAQPYRDTGFEDPYGGDDVL